jgi:hypothetical protein
LLAPFVDRYIDRVSLNCVVLESVNLRPYIESWVESGIPDEATIYEWRPS